MDIQKENDKYLVSLVANCGATQDEINDLNFDDETGFFESNRLADWFISQINFGWKVWQAAKAKAVPEGFVLVPRQPNEKTLIKMSWSVALGEDQHGNSVCLSIDEAKQAYEAVIEAQEPAK